MKYLSNYMEAKQSDPSKPLLVRRQGQTAHDPSMPLWRASRPLWLTVREVYTKRHQPILTPHRARGRYTHDSIALYTIYQYTYYMTTNKPEAKTESHKGRPGWVARRTAINFGVRHAQMIDDLVAEAKKTDHRANMTVVIEDAIERAHTALIK